MADDDPHGLPDEESEQNNEEPPYPGSHAPGGDGGAESGDDRTKQERPGGESGEGSQSTGDPDAAG